MQHSNTMSLARLAVITMTAFTMAAAAFETSYCSTQNTGSTDMFFWTWQSNGKCSDHCNALGTYAFAVIKYTDCWCSNYIPSTQADTADCQKGCPGFKTEACGDDSQGLFAYIKLAGSPSGTQGGSQPTSATVPSSTEESSSTEATTRDPPSTTMRTTSAAPATSSITTTQQPVTTPMVFTESGVIVTRTVVVTPTPTPASATSNNTEKKSNTGAIVGGAVGGVVGLFAIVGGILFFLWRRRQQQRMQNGEVDSSGITRNTSTMSRSGLLGGFREKSDSQQLPPIVTNMGSQRSRHDTESSSPMAGSERRYSQPVLVDSRLNPRAVLTFHGSNESRDSIGSIDDSRDYGRQLNVVNPDPTRG